MGKPDWRALLSTLGIQMKPHIDNSLGVGSMLSNKGDTIGIN